MSQLQRLRCCFWQLCCTSSAACGADSSPTDGRCNGPENQSCLVQARTLSGDSSNWSVIQLLLALATLAAVLLVPSLMALMPNFNGHVLPSAPHKVYSGNIKLMHRANTAVYSCDVSKAGVRKTGRSRCTYGRDLCCLLYFL